MGDVAGCDVLCLASGGGQQSAAFGLLGANVTVLDLCPTQLERDRVAAAHYGLRLTTVEGDMRDLSCFAPESFDLVWHAHSINFVPDARQVFAQVARVLRPGGRYRLSCANPFCHGLCKEYWDGRGYPLHLPYVDGGEVVYEDPEWDVWDEGGQVVRVKGPLEFRHGLGTLVNGLLELGFVLLGLWEALEGDPNAQPGTWDHLQAIAPPYLRLWAEYRP